MSDANIRFTYGTAGYRGNAQKLGEVVKCTAYYAAVRARRLNHTVGLMITASHNPPEDNGVKVIDITGGMLPIECEEDLDRVVNSNSALTEIVDTIDTANTSADARLVIGTDTRASATTLLAYALEGCALAAVPAIVYHRHTTPQLHYLVHSMNNRIVTHLDYVTRFKQAYYNFITALPDKTIKSADSLLYLDCANGVGALWVNKIFLPDGGVKLYYTNVRQKDLLNNRCGADYVKHKNQLPNGMGPLESNVRCASLDGDADRIIYYYTIGTATNDVVLLDGDHIAALFTYFIKQMLSELYSLKDLVIPRFTLGVVQTAYSNGNSKRFYEKMDVETIVTKTGVKHLEAAVHRFDVGIYFEANGHGTVCFSRHFHNFINHICEEVENDSNYPRSMKLLYYFSQIVNEVVGDGIADLLAVEALLRFYSWDHHDWQKHTFKSIPTAMTKIYVSNPAIFRCSADSEEVLEKPDNVQVEIDKEVAKYPNARAFVRPSGTESMVRILAEAENYETAKILMSAVERIITPFF